MRGSHRQRPHLRRAGDGRGRQHRRDAGYVDLASRHERSDRHAEQPRRQHPADGHADLDRDGSAGKRLCVWAPVGHVRVLRERDDVGCDRHSQHGAVRHDPLEHHRSHRRRLPAPDRRPRRGRKHDHVRRRCRTSGSTTPCRRRVRTTPASTCARRRRSPARQPTPARASTTSTSSALRRVAARGRRSPRTRRRSTASRPASTRRACPTVTTTSGQLRTTSPGTRQPRRRSPTVSSTTPCRPRPSTAPVRTCAAPSTSRLPRAIRAARTPPAS